MPEPRTWRPPSAAAEASADRSGGPVDWRAFVRSQLPEITGDAARDADIVDELAQHLDELFDDLRAAGMTRDQALAAATRQLHDHQLVRALRRASTRPTAAPIPPPMAGTAGRGGRNIMRDLWNDLRYGIRLLLRNPGFSTAAILTLTLGIGMTAAIFSVVDGVLLRPMPYPDAARLVMVWETDRDSGTDREPGSLPDFLDYRQRSRITDALGALRAFDLTLEPERGDPMRVAAITSTPEVLQMLGIRPLAGRLFTAADDQVGAPMTALISDRLWNAAFARGNVIGQTLRINGRPVTIIGVVPGDADVGITQILRSANYGGGFATRDARMRVDIWSPLQGDPARLPRSTHPILMMGRLRPGATVSAAQQHFAGIAADLEREYRNDNDARGVSIQPLRAVIFGPVDRPLVLLMAAVAVVLVMACVNVANLLLTRTTRRVREVAVRSALGAEMPRLVRQFVAENLAMTLVAGVLALAVAFVLLRGLLAVAPGDIPRLAGVGINGRVLLVAFASAVTIGLVFSLVPVFQARRDALQTLLHADDRHASAGRDGRVLRSLLVVAEVAFAVLLVTGAGLLIKSFWHLHTTSPGFDATGVVKAEFQLPPTRYPMPQAFFAGAPAIERFNEAVTRRISALPGVEMVAFAAEHPLDGGFASSFLVVGREAEGRTWPEISIRRVTPNYFRTLRIPIVRGRGLEARDADLKQRGVVINQIVADRFFRNDPIGQSIRMWGGTWTVVGVVGNERFQGVTKEPPIAVYLPLNFVPSPGEALVVRGTGDMRALANAVRAAIREQDPLLVAFGLEPLADTLANSINEQRFLMLLLGLFAALALALAAVGIHGVLSCTVAQRTREIGIRMALGANAGRVVRSVVRQGVILAAVGLVIGLGLAVAFARVIAGLLYGVRPTDVTTIAAVMLVLGAVAAVSVWLPAWRAVRVDPLVALRQE